MNTNYNLFLQQLGSDLQSQLPGYDAQMRMAPNPRSGNRLPYDAPQSNARTSAVLILLYPQQGELYLPLILRPTYNGTHSGQVSFPGGAAEVGDLDTIATALREANEEVGIDANQVTVLGALTPLYVFVSNHLVTPIVAWSEQPPQFCIDPHEVAQLLEVPVRALLDPQNHKIENWQLRDRSADVPFYTVANQQVWGATAMMLSEFLSLPAWSMNRQVLGENQLGVSLRE